MEHIKVPLPPSQVTPLRARQEIVGEIGEPVGPGVRAGWVV